MSECRQHVLGVRCPQAEFGEDLDLLSDRLFSVDRIYRLRLTGFRAPLGQSNEVLCRLWCHRIVDVLPNDPGLRLGVPRLEAVTHLSVGEKQV